MTVGISRGPIRRVGQGIVCLALLGAACCPSAPAKEKTLAWTLIQQALLHASDPALRDWSVYQAGKKSDSLLLQVGNHFLFFDVRSRQIFELDASKMEQKAGKILWNPEDRPAKPLATSDWNVNENNGSYQVAVQLGVEKVALNLQIPSNPRSSPAAPNPAAAPISPPTQGQLPMATPGPR